MGKDNPMIQQTWILVVLALLIGGVMGYVLSGALVSKETSTTTGQATSLSTTNGYSNGFEGTWVVIEYEDGSIIAIPVKAPGAYQDAITKAQHYNALKIVKVSIYQDGELIFQTRP